MLDRFVEKFRVTPGCWVWTAGLGSNGYGHFWNGLGPTPAHRMSYMLFIGAIPDGLGVLHKCDNRLCVNPDHFFLGDNADNTADMVSKGRQRKGAQVAASKLDDEQVKLIRSDSRSDRKVAHDYGVSHTTINDIRSNKIWRHI